MAISEQDRHRRGRPSRMAGTPSLRDALAVGSDGQDLDVVGVEGRVGGEDGHVELDGLGDEEAIEGIAVVGREGGYGQGVAVSHGDAGDPDGSHPGGDVGGDGLGEVEPAGARLDGQLPTAGGG